MSLSNQHGVSYNLHPDHYYDVLFISSDCNMHLILIFSQTNSTYSLHLFCSFFFARHATSFSACGVENHW